MKAMTNELPPIAARRQKVQSAEYGLVVLKTLGRAGGSLSLTALSEALGASPAKIHRYLASLKESGFVFQDGATSRYILGQESIAIGLAAMRQANVLTLAAPVLLKLTEDLNVSCFVAVLGNSGPTIMRWEEPLQAITVNVRAGSTLPILWSATGRAFGAFSNTKYLNEEIAKELSAATHSQQLEFPNRAAIDMAFAKIRDVGCVVVQDLLLKGISAVAAPIFDSRQRVCAVLTALGTSGQIDPNPDSPLAQYVMQSSKNITTALGGSMAITSSPAD